MFLHVSNPNRYSPFHDPNCLREQLISCLQTEERERQWHFTQLELISQKIRSLPLTSSLEVSTKTWRHIFQRTTPPSLVSLKEAYQASKLGRIHCSFLELAAVKVILNVELDNKDTHYNLGKSPNISQSFYWFCILRY